MSNRFDIAVTATDRFSVTFKTLNAAAGKAVAPLKGVSGESKKAFDVAPIKAWTSGLFRGVNAVEKFASSVGGLSPTAQALLGIGSAGGAIAMGAAVAAFTTRYADMGTQVLRTSQRLAVGTEDLQLWSAAAKVAGYRTEVVAENMESLGVTLHEAQFGRNPKAIEALAALGLNLRLKNGVVDVTATLLDLSRAMERLNDPYTKRALADVFGLSPEMMQLLSLGPTKLMQLIDKARAAGQAQTDDALRNAERQKQAIGELGLAWERLANKMGAAIAPRVTDILNWLSGSPEFKKSDVAPGPTGSMGRPALGAFGRSAASGATTAGGAIDARTGEGKAQILEDIAYGARFSSPAVRERVMAGVNSPIVEVRVNIPNAPAGTTVQARSVSGDVPVRVSRSMPTAGTP